jgi:serine/threonine protein kinase
MELSSRDSEGLNTQATRGDAAGVAGPTAGEREGATEAVKATDEQRTPGDGHDIEAQRLRSFVHSRLFGTEGEPVRIGRYVVLDRLGSGGMGVVYSAYDNELDRKVAIKLLHPERAGAGDDARARLLREAQAMAKLSHPNVIGVYGVGTREDQVYVATELVKGTTLKSWVKEKKPGARQVVDVFMQAGRGLSAAHAAGLVHRDFKPENVLIADDGRVRVLDFGLARALQADPLEETVERPSTDSGSQPLDAPITKTGAITGTPAYMSPEQYEGKQADERSDEFSFCVALWEALFKERPFQGDTQNELTTSILEGRVSEPPKGSKVPAYLRAIVRKGLRPKPADRFPSMQALLAELHKDPARTRRQVFLAAAVAAVVGFGGWGIYSAQQARAQQCQGAEQRLAGIWDDARKDQVRGA